MDRVGLITGIFLHDFWYKFINRFHFFQTPLNSSMRNNNTHLLSCNLQSSWHSFADKFQWLTVEKTSNDNWDLGFPHNWWLDQSENIHWRCITQFIIWVNISNSFLAHTSSAPLSDSYVIFIHRPKDQKVSLQVHTLTSAFTLKLEYQQENAI